jgi:hypothetical protein
MPFGGSSADLSPVAQSATGRKVPYENSPAFGRMEFTVPIIRFCSNRVQKGGGVMLAFVTYSDLFAYTMVIVSIIALILRAKK